MKKTTDHNGHAPQKDGKTVTGREESLGLLAEAGLSKSDAEKLLDSPGPERTSALVSRFRPDMTGRELAGAMRAITRLGDREAVADFLIGVIQGPPLASQLMALRAAEREPFIGIQRVRDALNLYQGDHDNLTHAFSVYQDHYGSGCDKRSCGCD